MNNSVIFKIFNSFVYLIIYLIPLTCDAQDNDNSRKIDSLQKVLQIQQTDTGKVKILIALSEAFMRTDTARRMSYALDALRLAEQIKWDKGIILANSILSGICENCNRSDKSIEYAKQALAVAKRNGNRVSEAKILNQIGNNYLKLSQYKLALEYYKEVLALKTDANLELGVMTNMGVAYTNLADYPRALACYDSSLKQLDALIQASGYSNLNDTLQMGVIYLTKGDIYKYTGDFDKSMAHYSKALELGKLTAKQTKDKYLEVNALKGIASTYVSARNNEKAIEYYNTALSASEEIKDPSLKIKEESHINCQLSSAYFEKGDIALAMNYAQKALHQATNNHFQELLPEIYVNLGKILTQTGDTKKAIDYLSKAVEYCKESGALSREQDALKALSSAYKQAGQYAKALDAYEQYKAISDSLFSIGKYNELARIDLKNEYDRKQVADSVRQTSNYRLRIQRQKAFTYSGFAGLLVALVLAFFIYRNYSHQRKANVIISKAKDAVDEEKGKSDALLLNILPGDVANELKQHGDVQPKLFDNVTVLFTDFVDFTVAGDRLTPQQLVAELHACFKMFDAIIGKYKIEKIKTVGDAYIAVSGLPQPNANHAEDIIKAALEIRDFMLARKKQLPENTFEVRLGVNSGPVVAGIVGVRKFAYDIWGDTVNVAARMEQYSQEGKVNISEKTYVLVKDKFDCADRGVLNVKNKGQMSMYFVEHQGA